jgi:adenosylhomocysteine nucleosidase
MKKLGIICAVSVEANPFVEAMQNAIAADVNKMPAWTCKLFGRNAVILRCGISKVNGAMATQILIDRFGCDFIIMSGTAGALCPKLSIGDTVVATATRAHDVVIQDIDKHYPFVKHWRFETEKAFVAAARKIKAQINYDIYFGDIVSGEYFVHGETRANLAKAHPSALAVDMEVAAVAHVCYSNNIPFAAVKSITDTAQFDSENDFLLNVASASKNSFEVIHKALTNLTPMEYH